MNLPTIPLLDVGPDWPTEALAAETPRALALLRDARGRAPDVALRMADRLARDWLTRADAACLPELDAIARSIGRPGAHFLNVSYDFGCSTVAAEGPDGPRLARVLDWPTRGLGRHAVALRIAGLAGPWATVAWPGYTGVLHGVAAGRFAAALNQAPLPRKTGLWAADWALSAARVWRRPRLTPAHLLRAAFETARDAAEALRMLVETPLSSGAIFTLAGLRAGETWTVERGPDTVGRPQGPAVAANAWRTPGWRGRPRGDDNDGRLAAMARLTPGFGEPADWLAAPVLNERTRMVFVGDPVSGDFLAQGFEAMRPVTAVLRARAAHGPTPHSAEMRHA